MTINVTTTNSDGMNGIDPRCTRINVSVDVLKSKVKTGRSHMTAAAEAIEFWEDDQEASAEE